MNFKLRSLVQTISTIKNKLTDIFSASKYRQTMYHKFKKKRTDINMPHIKLNQSNNPSVTLSYLKHCWRGLL